VENYLKYKYLKYMEEVEQVERPNRRMVEMDQPPKAGKIT
jgi:hypothetical protein